MAKQLKMELEGKKLKKIIEMEGILYETGFRLFCVPGMKRNPIHKYLRAGARENGL